MTEYFEPNRLIEFLTSFVAFDSTPEGFLKRVAKPHQCFAVNKAVSAAKLAAKGDGKAGVVWHTQGSGKSMEMELYANLIGRDQKLLNPTITVVTDRTELDLQPSPCILSPDSSKRSLQTGSPERI